MRLQQKLVQGKFGLETVNETGAILRTDASEKVGGENFGLRPMELLASGLASCASIDILLILEKQRQRVDRYEVQIDAARVDDTPAIFKQINLIISLFGEINEEKAKKAADLTFTKYCSVSKILEKSCQINYSIQVNPTV